MIGENRAVVYLIDHAYGYYVAAQEAERKVDFFLVHPATERELTRYFYYTRASALHRLHDGGLTLFGVPVLFDERVSEGTITALVALAPKRRDPWPNWPGREMMR